MRFLTRALTGVFLSALTLGFLVLGVGTLMRAGGDGDSGRGGGRPAQERVYTVNVKPIDNTELVPVTRAFGRLQSWQTADLRAAVGGTIVSIDDAVRDGGRVARGQTLFVIDPTIAENALASRDTDLAEAVADQIDAQRSLELAEEELSVAQAQHTLREQSLERARDLARKGFDTTAGVEEAELAHASSAQSLVTRRQAIAAAEARLARTNIVIERRELALAAAERDLADTRVTSPFDGVLSGVNAVLGRRVNAGESLASLIDPSALEVAFRLSVEAFAQLVDDKGELLKQPLTVEFELGDTTAQVSARISRVGAEIGEGQTGRLIYAELTPPLPGGLGVGDFVTVAVEQPALRNVALIPRAAATDDGRVLIVGEDDRLREVAVTIERRQGDSLIVSDAPLGERVVLARTPQLGIGVQVKAIGPERAVEQRETVALTPDQQAQLRAVVERNSRIPADVKAGMLERIDSGEISASMWERMRNRIGGSQPAGESRSGESNADQASSGAASAGDTVALDDATRARLRALVENNSGMPDVARERVLEALKAERVPQRMIDRIEGGAGGRP